MLVLPVFLYASLFRMMHPVFFYELIASSAYLLYNELLELTNRRHLCRKHTRRNSASLPTKPT